MREGIRSFGPDDQTVIVFETLADSKSLFLTANTETVYAFAWLDTKDGPLVIEVPPNMLGLIDDFWFHYVTDIGMVGPDQGKGWEIPVAAARLQRRSAGRLLHSPLTDLRELVRRARLARQGRFQTGR
jgi:hypothetical protein